MKLILAQGSAPGSARPYRMFSGGRRHDWYRSAGSCSCSRRPATGPNVFACRPVLEPPAGRVSLMLRQLGDPLRRHPKSCGPLEGHLPVALRDPVFAWWQLHLVGQVLPVGGFDWPSMNCWRSSISATYGEDRLLHVPLGVLFKRKRNRDSHAVWTSR
jgi:hypothetical protein